MHPIDHAIRNGTLTQELLNKHAALPLPPLGDSYWGDCMRDHHGDPLDSAKTAALQMGQSMHSLKHLK